MSQLYQLKNGGVGHYCDVYKEEAVEKLGDTPMHKRILRLITSLVFQ